MSDDSYPKTYRLLSKEDFARLKSGAERFQTGTIRCFYKPNQLEHARLGISVSKKVGNAVTRNLFKRCIREFFRCSELKNTQLDLMVIVFPSLTQKYQNVIDQKFELRSSLKRLTNKLC